MDFEKNFLKKRKEFARYSVQKSFLQLHKKLLMSNAEFLKIV